MRILIAPDKFKHSLTSIETCEAIKRGLLTISKDLSVDILPMADGGDGLTEVIDYYLTAKKHSVSVNDPLFRTINSTILVSENGETAFIEMAKASGLMLLKPNEANCMYTTSFGTGELIKEAIRLKVKNIILGIGGSATNDCGIGMAAALGYRFLDKRGAELKPVGANLKLIEFIDSSNKIDLSGISFEIACDVTNPLTGQTGATLIFAKQKGAGDTEVDQLESGMIHFAELLKKELKTDVASVEGAGAAGGLGAGCMAFLDAKLIKGINLIMNLSNAEEYIRKTDLVITAEGRIDEQSLQGKVLSGIAQLCHKHNKTLLAFCGSLDIDKAILRKAFVEEAHSINEGYENSKNVFSEAKKRLSETVYKVVKRFVLP